MYHTWTYVGERIRKKEKNNSFKKKRKEKEKGCFLLFFFLPATFCLSFDIQNLIPHLTEKQSNPKPSFPRPKKKKKIGIKYFLQGERREEEKQMPGPSYAHPSQAMIPYPIPSNYDK